MIPISLYIHIPWCFNKCWYCSFVSYKLNKKKINSYLLNLIIDIDNDFSFKFDDRKICSIYIGGGTPNILSINNIKFLLKKILNNNYCNKNIEITIESIVSNNECYKFYKYYELGINRVSLGVQSFNNSILKNINRNYNLEDIINNIKLLKKCMFNSYNIDLIYGLPGQKLSDVIQDLKFIVDLGIPHLSWYQLDLLSVNKKYKFLDILPKYSIVEDMFFEGREFLLKNGYFQYEISSYVIEKRYYCLHNINYWKFGDYLGVGCSSHGKITLGKKICRIIKNYNLNKYLSGDYIKKISYLNYKDIIAEYFINILRLFLPFKYSDFEFFTSLKRNLIFKYIRLAILNKIIYKKDDYFFLNKDNFMFLDDFLVFLIK